MAREQLNMQAGWRPVSILVFILLKIHTPIVAEIVQRHSSREHLISIMTARHRKTHDSQTHMPAIAKAAVWGVSFLIAWNVIGGIIDLFTDSVIIPFLLTLIFSVKVSTIAVIVVAKTYHVGHAISLNAD